LKAVAIHAHNPGPFTGTGNTTWLIPGRVPVLVDAGTGQRQFLEDLSAALGGARLARVLVTHGHPDHAGGAVALAARMPHARFAKMPWPDRDGSFAVNWESLRDGESVEAGDEEVTVVHTPGHTPDHVCFWHRRTGTVFCGDLAVQGSSVVIPASSGGDLAAYLASLERVIALQPVQLLPAHGPVVEDPVSLLRQYLAHRREREEQVVAALRAGDTAPEAIVVRIYDNLPGPLVEAARESVMAHLVKLQREGRARQEGDGWKFTN
jgi:glyoxylase-like metal-dependent hydrolase (beta-lactamase superfamily II)